MKTHILCRDVPLPQVGMEWVIRPMCGWVRLLQSRCTRDAFLAGCPATHQGGVMVESTEVAVVPIKVGVIADQTGPLSFVGLANANVARMVIDELNAEGGLLGRPVVLVLEDSATDDAVAAAKAAKLVGRDQVDVVFGGIYSSTRQ